ncbi:MAG: pyridoxamine 5'-phosphate oxidase family protein [Acidimicrobiales bacterium]
MNWGEVAAFIDGAGLAHVATASASGHPHVAVVFVAREDGHLLLTMRSTSGKASNLRTNPRIAVMWQGNSAETYVW